MFDLQNYSRTACQGVIPIPPANQDDPDPTTGENFVRIPTIFPFAIL